MHPQAPLERHAKVARAFKAAFSSYVLEGGGESTDSAPGSSFPSTATVAAADVGAGGAGGVAGADDVGADGTATLLSRVLTAFDGARCVEEVLPLLPARLRAYGVDVVVWLLRWRMLQVILVFFFF